MRMVDLIEKKRDGTTLSSDEIEWIIRAVTNGDLPDYQVAAWLMAVYFRGMDDREIFYLTDAMAHSGDMTDLSALGDKTVDKHSTGGVGDKTTLIVAPLVASLGGIVAKMSGRGLGFTGGTVDKLESIPGFRTEMSREEFLSCATIHGLCVVGQSGNLAPADKKLYALRDVTGTVSSIPLIASSIMSKKLAAGAHSIVLDVKVGSGAFMKTREDARLLAGKMTAIGKAAGRHMTAILTDMDVPLGNAIGNAMEVQEAIAVLENHGPDDLTSLCITLASHMLSLALNATVSDMEEKCRIALRDGSAKKKLCEMVAAQGGDTSYIEHSERFKEASVKYTVRAKQDGYLSHMNAAKIGTASVLLGAGREKKGDPIDHSAGIMLMAKTGDFVHIGDPLAVFHTNCQAAIATAEEDYLSALCFSDEKPATIPLVYEMVD